MNFFFICRVMLFILLASFTGCQQQQLEKPQGTLIVVGERQLTLAQFHQELKLNYPDISNLSEATQLKLKAQLIKQLIDRELILGEASRLNVQLSPDELDAALADIRGTYSIEEFNQILNNKGKTYSAWISALKLRLLTAKVSEAILTPQIEVTDKETEDYYRANKKSYHRPVEIRARQMLFPTREEAVEVLKLVKDGGDFATLAQEHSHSPDNEKGGALGYFSAGQLPVEFDEVLFKLPVRQVSDPVESPYGYHLFLVEKRRRAGQRLYDAVKDEIREKLYHEKEESAFHLWLEQLQKTTETSVNWALLKHPGLDSQQIKDKHQ